MRIGRIARPVLTLATVFASGLGAQQPDAGPAAGQRLAGTVRVEGTERPLPNVRIALIVQRAETLTDSLGRFVFERVRRGVDTLEVSLLDYGTEPVPIVIGPSHEQRLDLLLAIPTTRLEELKVTVRSNRTRQIERIERRLRQGIGSNITAADIASREPIRLSQMFFGLTRVRVRDTQVRLVGRGRRACSPLIFVDGFLQRFATINNVAVPENVYAIKVYHEPWVPVEFSRPFAACGSIVIWTKRRLELGGTD